MLIKLRPFRIRLPSKFTLRTESENALSVKNQFSQQFQCYEYSDKKGANWSKSIACQLI